MRGHNAFSTYALPSVAIFHAFCVPCHSSLMVSNVLSAGVNVLWIQWALRLKGLKTINMQKEGDDKPQLLPGADWTTSTAAEINHFLRLREHLLSTEATSRDVHGKGFMEDRWKFWNNQYFMLEDAQRVRDIAPWPSCPVMLGQSCTALLLES